MLKKILNLTGVDALTKVAQVQANGGKESSVTSSFMCYCNRVFVGETASVKECWKTCWHTIGNAEKEEKQKFF